MIEHQGPWSTVCVCLSLSLVVCAALLSPQDRKQRQARPTESIVQGSNSWSDCCYYLAGRLAWLSYWQRHVTTQWLEVLCTSLIFTIFWLLSIKGLCVNKMLRWKEQFLILLFFRTHALIRVRGRTRQLWGHSIRSGRNLSNSPCFTPHGYKCICVFEMVKTSTWHRRMECVQVCALQHVNGNMNGSFHMKPPQLGHCLNQNISLHVTMPTDFNTWQNVAGKEMWGCLADTIHFQRKCLFDRNILLYFIKRLLNSFSGLRKKTATIP